MSDREDEDYDGSEDGEELAEEPVAPAAATEAEAPPQDFYRRIGEYTSLAFVMPAAMLVGFFGGRWIGSWLGGPGIGSGIGLVLGTGAAFLSLYHSLRRLERGG